MTERGTPPAEADQKGYLLEIPSKTPLDMKSLKERLSGTKIQLDEGFGVIPAAYKEETYIAAGSLTDEEYERIMKEEQDEENQNKLGISFWADIQMEPFNPDSKPQTFF